MSRIDGGEDPNDVPFPFYSEKTSSSRRVAHRVTLLNQGIDFLPMTHQRGGDDREMGG